MGSTPRAGRFAEPARAREKEPVHHAHRAKAPSHQADVAPRRARRTCPSSGAPPSPRSAGPLIGSTSATEHRNVIGTHAGSYAVYRALAVAAGALDPSRRPDLTDTAPTDRVGPHPQWSEPGRIVSLDPFGAVVAEVFAEYLEQGYDIRPTIAVTKAHVDVPEIGGAIEAGRLRAGRRDPA